ncbi:MAG: metal-dependent hydrolase [Candidatus Binatia bacterium]
MATIPTHAVSGIALASFFLKQTDSRYWWIIGAAAAMVPDLDILAFIFGIPYESPSGHRGITHSLFFAAAFAWLLFVLAGQFSREVPPRIGVYFFAAIASHGFIDAFTDGGLGVGFFIPLSSDRFFFPLRPIPVSPIGIGWFFSHEGWFILKTELLWVWLPSAVTFLTGWLVRNRFRR